MESSGNNPPKGTASGSPPSSGPPPRVSLSRAKRVLFGLLFLLILSLVLELAFRLAYRNFGSDSVGIDQYRALVVRGLENRFLPHPYLSYSLHPRRDHVTPAGFAGNVTGVERVEPSLRIAFLGGSTTASGNPEGYEGSFPRFALELLEDRVNRPVEVQNWGVPAWTTAETLINYCLNVADYQPDLVVIHHAVNDLRPRALSPQKPDYSHYRRCWDYRPARLDRILTRFSDLYVWVRLKTRKDPITIADVTEHRGKEIDRALAEDRPLLPATATPFRRNLTQLVHLVRANGSIPVLATLPMSLKRCPLSAESAWVRGLIEHNRIAAEVAEVLGVPLLDLAPPLNEHPEFLDLVHLSPQGNREKALLVVEGLHSEGLLE